MYNDVTGVNKRWDKVTHHSVLTIRMPKMVSLRRELETAPCPILFVGWRIRSLQYMMRQIFLRGRHLGGRRLLTPDLHRIKSAVVGR
jgi:hypothetical protein